MYLATYYRTGSQVGKLLLVLSWKLFCVFGRSKLIFWVEYGTITSLKASSLALEQIGGTRILIVSGLGRLSGVGFGRNSNIMENCR